MLPLFLNHPPLFVAGEVALGLSLALFAGALIAAIIRGVPGISQLREPSHLAAGVENGRGSLIGRRSSPRELSKGV
jgi:hypothetical protein